MALTNLHHLAIAFGLGLLVGLQREWTANRIAGIRTFPLITVLGSLAAMLADHYGGWIIGAGFLALAGMIVLGNVAKFKQGHWDPGLTTEVTALVMYAVGAALMAGFTTVGVAVGGGVAVLLQWKLPLHKFVKRLDDADLRAVVQLALIALVILPVLPDQAYDPYGVLNPYKIWLMVVLIVGISLCAHAAYKLLGARVGTVLTGILGGLISSTATTVSYARRTHGRPRFSAVAAVVIMISSTIVFARVLFEISVVAPATLQEVAPPLLAMAGYMSLVSVGAFFFMQHDIDDLSQGQAASNLTTAIVFGLLYAVVLWAIAAAKAHFGQGGLYVVAAFSGLVDMDAITLSTAQMIKSDRLDAQTGWRLIMVGALANILFKTAMIALLGALKLLGRVVVVFGLTLLGGGLIIAFWPA